LEKNSFLSDHQSGFRPLNSTLTALLKNIIVWLKTMDEGKINVAVFLDLKKAFDTVDHDILTQKMQSYGIIGNELKWHSIVMLMELQILYFNLICNY